MTHNKHFKKNLIQKSKNWQLFEKLYTDGMQAEYDEKDAPRIPLLFHLIWLGSPVPQSYRALEKRLKEFHPGCQVIVWTDKEVQKLTLINRRAFDRATNYGEKSDIVRYEILYQQGGVYLDGDFEILRSFKALMQACNLFAGIAYSMPRDLFTFSIDIELYNGLIGVSPGHPVMKQCIDTLSSKGPREDVNAILARTGPIHFTRCF